MEFLPFSGSNFYSCKNSKGVMYLSCYQYVVAEINGGFVTLTQKWNYKDTAVYLAQFLNLFATVGYYRTAEDIQHQIDRCRLILLHSDSLVIPF